MLDQIRHFFSRRTGDEPAPADRATGDLDLQVAACALLLELAHADGEFAESERTLIANAIGRHFKMDEATAWHLMALAESERRQSIDHFQFTQRINEGYDLGQKMVLAEIMWAVILADGELADHEAYLMRKLGGLLGLEPGYLAQARKAATTPP